jgi:phytoene synthase
MPATGADLAACREILAKGSKSFRAASRLLPARVRGPAAVVYAFCRLADDTVDAATGSVSDLRATLAGVFSGESSDSPVDRALAAVVADHRLPRAPFDALLEGLAWDAAGRRYQTISDVYAYSARVAASVGVLMTLLMERRDLPTLARACDLGVAMQLTNIARDVGEDAGRARLYLPAAWLREEGVDPDAWRRRPSHCAALGRVVARLLGHADALYRRADRGIPLLPRDCRPAIRAARLVYADIGREIARRGFDSVSGRARTGPVRKALLVLRACAALATAPGPACVEPPLEEARFLVDAVGR